MTQSLTLQERAIILAIEDNKPSTLNPDILKLTNVIPSDWELAQQPVISNNFFQAIFKRGEESFSIIAETNRIILLETMSGKAIEEPSIYDIAKKYIQTFPNAKYIGLGINPRGYTGLPGQEQDAARKFMNKMLFAPGSWQEVNGVEVRATVNLVYPFERAPLYLSINEAALRNPDETTTPILLFSGSFSYEAKGETQAEKLASVLQSMENWESDIQAYSDIINNQFLGQTTESSKKETIVPDVFSMNNVAAAV